MVARAINVFVDMKKLSFYEIVFPRVTASQQFETKIGNYVTFITAKTY